MGSTKIKESTQPKTFTNVSRVKTNLQGGGTCLWKPEDELEREELSVNENGQWSAEDLGLYGWTKVTANVPNAGSVTGHDPTTGEDVTVTVDPTTGEIVETVEPYAIRIENLPVILQYNDGDTIDYTGIFVGAYDAHGNRLYDVPYNELAFPVTIARSDGSGSHKKTSPDYPDGVPYEIDSFHAVLVDDSPEYLGSNKVGVNENGADTYFVKQNGGGISFYKANIIGTGYGVVIAFSSMVSNVLQWLFRDGHGVGGGGVATQSIEKNGKIAYYCYLDRMQEVVGTLPVEIHNFYDIANIAWTLIYGTDGGGVQTLPVQWQRPSDYKTLEDTFEISVEG